MSQASNKVTWCLNKAKRELEQSKFHRGLVKTKEDIEFAKMHIMKAEHNLKAALYFEKGGFSDWSASAFFYCIYHCFLAILKKYGYESRNQECTIAVIEMLKEEGKITIDDKFIDALKITEMEEQHESSIIKIREDFQYGVNINFEEKEKFNELVEMSKEMINKTNDMLK